MFGKKPERPEPADDWMADYHAQRQKIDEESRLRREAQRAELQATVDATPEPADIYRVTKDFETGQFIVSRWVNRVGVNCVAGLFYHYLDQGYTPYPQRFPTAKAAQAFIKAMVDPTTNLMGFDANGDPVAVSAGKSSAD